MDQLLELIATITSVRPSGSQARARESPDRGTRPDRAGGCGESWICGTSPASQTRTVPNVEHLMPIECPNAIVSACRDIARDIRTI